MPARFVLAEKYDLAGLANHLFLFHALYVGDPDRKEGPGLLQAHREMHASSLSATRRIPHVHDDIGFKKGSQ